MEKKKNISAKTTESGSKKMIPVFAGYQGNFAVFRATYPISTHLA